MNIEQITQSPGVLVADLTPKVARKISSDADGTTYLVPLTIGGKTAAALLFAPKGEERAEFVCGGRIAGVTGPWMKVAGEEYVRERNCILANDGSATVGAPKTNVSEEVLALAVTYGFRIVAEPNGNLSFVRPSEDNYELTITNDSWIGEEHGFICPFASSEEWIASRNDLDANGNEIGLVQLNESTSFLDAIGSCEMMADPAISGREQVDVIMSRDELINTVGWIPEFEKPQVQQVQAAEVAEPVYDSGSQLQMF